MIPLCMEQSAVLTLGPEKLKGDYIMNENHLIKWNLRTVVFLGVLVAMQLVLTRVFVIELGFGRISLGSICTILSGLWFGPAAGALVGFSADVMGCLMKGYVLNPLITIAAMLWGVIPALFRPLFSRGSKIKKHVWLSVGIALSAVFCTLGFGTAGLVLMNGYNFYAIMPARLIQFCVMTVIYCLITNLLYFSSLTSVVKGVSSRKL